MRRFPLLLLALLLCLTGCRDSLVDEPPGGVDEPLPTEIEEEPTARGIYVKGKYTLGVGETAHYRAEALPDAVRYEWTHTRESTGSVSGTPTDPLDRLYDLTGAAPGVASLRVIALDAQNREIGVGQIVIQIGN